MRSPTLNTENRSTVRPVGEERALTRVRTACGSGRDRLQNHRESTLRPTCHLWPLSPTHIRLHRLIANRK